MDAATIPAEIVAVDDDLAAALAAWTRAHPNATLADHEQAVLAIARRVMAAALRAVLTCAQGLDRPVTRRLRTACPGCATRSTPHDPVRARQVLTICGPVRLVRPYYYCRPCRRGWAPTDRRLGLARRATLSPGAVRWAAQVGAATTFRAAAALLADIGGLALGVETVRTHVEQVGTAVVAARQQTAAFVETEREPPGPVTAAPGVLVVQADGAQLRYLDDWHEVKLGLVAGCDPGDPHTLREPTYLAARAPAATFGALLIAEAAQRGALDVIGWEHAPGDDPAWPTVPALAVLREVVVLGDGAPWIWSLAAEHFGRRTEILDWYHATEHLWTLARALHGDGTPAARAWVDQAMTVLWDGGSRPLRALLAETIAPTPDAAEVLRLQRGYFTTNAGRTDYPTYRARGLPIGSGAVESAAKQLVQARMKRAGMRWSLDGAQAVLALTAQFANARPLLEAA